jgi:hypothetical protein
MVVKNIPPKTATQPVQPLPHKPALEEKSLWAKIHELASSIFRSAAAPEPIDNSIHEVKSFSLVESNSVASSTAKKVEGIHPVAPHALPNQEFRRLVTDLARFPQIGDSFS